jgi:hypothetical protein
MNVQAIYAMARSITGTNSTSMPDATLLPFLNLAYHKLENSITQQVNEDFFYDELLANTVSGQREYTLPVKSGTTA